MLTRLLAISLLVPTLALPACRTSGTPTPAQPIADAPVAFPGDWLGTWTGPASLHWPDGRTRAFEMSLTITPTADPARYTWTVVYAEGDQKQTRPYELVVLDAPTGRYAIDEKNGITLPTTLFAGTLRSAFAVEGVQVVTNDRLERGPDGDRLVSEMISLDAKTTSATGGGDIPAVTILRPTTLQRAVLRRVK